MVPAKARNTKRIALDASGRSIRLRSTGHSVDDTIRAITARHRGAIVRRMLHGCDWLAQKGTSCFSSCSPSLPLSVGELHTRLLKDLPSMA
jgi:hypothetical protein